MYDTLARLRPCKSLRYAQFDVINIIDNYYVVCVINGLSVGREHAG